MAKKTKVQVGEAPVAEAGSCYALDDGPVFVPASDVNGQELTSDEVADLVGTLQGVHAEVVAEVDVSLTEAAKADAGPKKAVKPTKKPAMTVQEADNALNHLLANCVENGLVGFVPITPYIEAFNFVMRQKVEKGKVSQILGIRAAYLWFALETLEKLASENLARISKDRNAKAFYTNRKNIWIGSAIDRAKYVLNLQHSTLLPAERVEFKPQWMDSDLRKKIQDLLIELQKVVKFATCPNDGKPVGIGKWGDPFVSCADCHKSDLNAAENLELNLKLAEKNDLLRDLDGLMSALDSARTGWIGLQVGRGWLKAEVAFNNAFKQEIEWRREKVETFRTAVKPDFEAAKLLVGYINTTINEVHAFQHNDWCHTCFGPTYPDKKSRNKDVMSCESCDRVKKINADQPVAAIDDKAREVIAGMEGVTVEVAGETIVGGIAVESDEIDPSNTPLPVKVVSGKQKDKYVLGAIHAHAKPKAKKGKKK